MDAAMLSLLVVGVELLVVVLLYDERLQLQHLILLILRLQFVLGSLHALLFLSTLFFFLEGDSSGAGHLHLFHRYSVLTLPA